MEYKWHEFGKISDYNDLENYLKPKCFSHKDYCHYTRLKIAANILENKEFWLSNVENFNDYKDFEQFKGKNPKLFYSLCFSTGVNENLALWYMYAGMDGKGARLRLTAARIKRLINNGDYTLYEVDGSNIKIKKVLKLEKDISMKLTFKDILYFKKRNNLSRVDLKYNTMTNYIFLSDEFQKFEQKNIGFCKELIWYYEKETRLLVELIGDAACKIEDGKNYIIALDFDDSIYKSIKLDLAPEIETVDEVINTYDSINKFFTDTSHIRLSEYSGYIRMNFCKRCDKNIK